MKRKGFTLVELLIVIVVFSILVIVLFRTYDTIMRLSVRSEFQKNIQTDVLFVNQVMHSLADEYTIDYEAYKDSDSSIMQNGMVDTLHLVKKDDPSQTVTLSYHGRGEESTPCYSGPIDHESLVEAFDNEYNCALYYTKNSGSETPLTTNQTLVTHVARQLVPYQDNELTFAQATQGSTSSQRVSVYDTIAYPGVVMYWRAYHRGYGLRGSTNVSQVVQWFFSLTDDAQL